MRETLPHFSPRPDKARRRGRRITWAAAAAGCLVVAGFVVLHRAAVRDHVEAWRFVATRETETVTPGGNEGTYREPLSILADSTGLPLIFDPGSDAFIRRLFESSFGLARSWAPPPDQYEQLRTLSGEAVLDALRQDGYRILEQRFPREAYVVVGY
ncbi:MAG TPA: hypothetical protein VMT52_20115 [Planctomycetota bacterium]|nr:hypothetical protein [Planctomycetota bacterium]